MFRLVRIVRLWIEQVRLMKRTAGSSDFDSVMLCHLTAMSFGVYPLPGTMLAQPSYHEIEEEPVTLGN
jgi:hypothetical protein